MPSNSSRSTRAKKPTKKPAKPHRDFPLFPHATKRWAKKVKGRLHYFGPWSDPQAALERWLAVKDDLLAGRTPRVKTPGGLTIVDLVNRFLTAKQRMVDTGEIVSRTHRDYLSLCDQVIKALGRNCRVDDLTPDDFDVLRERLSRGRSPVTFGTDIQRARVMFKFAYDQGLIDRPVRYGQAFRKPTQKVLRKSRAAAGPRMFEAAELRRIVDTRQPLRAMALLGINAAFGQSDIANLPQSALDLDGGWCDFPRPKTGITRRCSLWPETALALRDAIAMRPEPSDPIHRDLAFLTTYGNQWGRTTSSNTQSRGWPIDAVSPIFNGHLANLGLKRPRLAFYALRHTFETIASETLDQPAIDLIMGHADHSMAAAYRERIGDDRLLAVTNHVRKWLFGQDVGEGPIELGQENR